MMVHVLQVFHVETWMRIDPAAADLLRFPAGTSPSTSTGASVFSLRHTSDDRINGSIPAWGQPDSAKKAVEQALSNPLPRQKLAPDLALSLAEEPAPETMDKEDSFGFLDIIDMVNPLQHIPVVGTIYRAVTGDSIKPIAQIVGGAAFGGIAGAASGVANAIVTAKTGKDIGANVLGMVMKDEAPNLPTTASTGTDTTIAVAALSTPAKPRYNE